MKMNKICQSYGRRILSVLFIIALITTLFVSCKKDGDDINFPDDTSDVGTSDTGTDTSDKDSEGESESESESGEPIIVPESCPACNSDGISSTVLTPATCDEQGMLEYKCASCGYTGQQVIEAKGCALIIDAAVEETCNKSGLTQGMHCSVCGKIYVKQNIIPPNTDKHKLDDNKVCTICGVSFNNGIGVWIPN